MIFLFFKYILSIQICNPNMLINYFKDLFVWVWFWYNGVPWNYLLQLKILWVVVRKRHNTQEQDKFWQARVYEGWTSKLMDRQIYGLKSFDIFRRWWVLSRSYLRNALSFCPRNWLLYIVAIYFMKIYKVIYRNNLDRKDEII